MEIDSTTRDSFRDARFPLWSVFEFVTLCAVMCALSPVIGVGASACLMMLALFLWLKTGMAALVMFMAACLLADWSGNPRPSADPLIRQLVVISAATAVCGWYALRILLQPRRLWPNRAGPAILPLLK